jgi:hypothetical protein
MSAVIQKDINVLFKIAVRARPIKGMGGTVATHCYLALLDQNNKVVDTLSFDPSNSNGRNDADPTDYSRGSVIVEGDCNISTWKELASNFIKYADAKPYILANHNCCNAVMDALVSTSLTHSQVGIIFAREANDTWANWNGVLDGDSYSKKNS